MKNKLNSLFVFCIIVMLMACNTSSQNSESAICKRWKLVSSFMKADSTLFLNKGMTITFKQDSTLSLINRLTYKSHYFSGKWKIDDVQQKLVLKLTNFRETLLGNNNSTGGFSEINSKTFNTYLYEQQLLIELLNDTILHVYDHDSEAIFVPYLPEDTISQWPGSSNIDYTKYEHLKPKYYTKTK